MREEGGGAGLPQPTAGGWPSGSAACIGLAAAGLVLLVAGAAWLIDAAVAIARALGLSELIIGLTVVAFGTSLPEAATSLLAAWRGERDIAVGNVVGSNIFNILGVLGASALVSAGGVTVSPAALWFDLPVMLGASLACLPIFATGHVINRWEGALFLFYYAAYAAYLILEALDHDAQAAFGWTMLAFVIPLTAATLAVTLYRHFRRPASAR
jgi:cation:H+ antiporter